MSSALKAGLLLALVAFDTVRGGQVQKPGLVLPNTARAHRDAVQHIFVTSYEAYRTFAFGHDDLQPVSETFNDGRNGWGASIVDAMTTIKIMGLDDYFAEAVNFTSNIDFSRSQTSDTVSVFETTIRYLGGLLSAYELSDQQYPALLAKATELADKLAYAWLGDSDIPFGFLDFSTNIPVQDTSNIAEAGTLTLEWATLSKHTGNDTYRLLAEKAVKHIAGLATPLPGIAVQGIDPSSGEFVGGFETWGGGSDSYFEYLIKYGRLTNTHDTVFVDTWKTAVDSTIRHLLRNSTVGNHTYTSTFDSVAGLIHRTSSHLTCFHGGNWILGGKLLNNHTIVQYGLALVDSCVNTYASTATGIGPEGFAYISADGNFTSFPDPTEDDLAFYNKHGFYILDGSSDYILRPEVLESNFYAWRVTGDTKYLDNAARAIDSFNKYLPTTVGFTGIDDVNDVNSTKIDDMESFWFAEVLKYLYLTFDDPEHISLDDYVFNTEAHPFKAPAARASYGGAGIKAKGAFKAKTGAIPVPSSSSFKASKSRAGSYIPY
ncbi:glycoside hydrolase family 47 protein [Mycena albidolilacea]|uniref:alpha-1,2-Mannosidase n=1 Tax=Mycena albidolilacea TaxID=1033008 RepID=A0AAD6ZY74_9AGAR|nr:glycoside hydrolase family 47 protein [Mycena albidolilacea]